MITLKCDRKRQIFMGVISGILANALFILCSFQVLVDIKFHWGIHVWEIFPSKYILVCTPSNRKPQLGMLDYVVPSDISDLPVCFSVWTSYTNTVAYHFVTTSLIRTIDGKEIQPENPRKRLQFKKFCGIFISPRQRYPTKSLKVPIDKQ